jgi:hypothetical protein
MACVAGPFRRFATGGPLRRPFDLGRGRRQVRHLPTASFSPSRHVPDGVVSDSCLRDVMTTASTRVPARPGPIALAVRASVKTVTC